MTFARGLVAAAAAVFLTITTACSPPNENPSPHTNLTTPESVTKTPTSSTPPPEPAPPSDEEVRAVAASHLMPPAVNFDDALHKLHAGVRGIFIPSWADPALLTEPGRDIHALRAQVGRDFEVAIDFEGGRVQRFAEIFGSFPTPQAMAAAGDPAQVEDIGRQVGQTLAARGVTVNFAPVLDVDGGNLEVVGDRAFSLDPHQTGEMGAAFARGLQQGGVRPVFKHFPGHGRASGDTHHVTAVTPPLPELFHHEFIPFDIAVPAVPEAGLMMGHMSVPELGDARPSSLNPAAYQLARDHLGFSGTIYTDDIGGMRAITDQMPLADAVVSSLHAGADVALWSTGEDINHVIDRVAEAIRAGEISAEF
ncbi:MAG: glycoside hydrolase family 3 N-terminal domain-containing protein [Corynebacterium camporealensis]|uniref:glycoside hydrolase family 3 N-terminal domain-containing protein n=1 Tax=Corynebacterium camporealensis TaxID=161896 RepID=UPI002A909E97|nr:glycoside hydrolase family 3 N-terminal domain-containing protein [Corynebacterium camporealensis]MDY5840168.1 glycoside hydrolase family 3 N-terminal domain-containing protein [Corynebacterium camporealensis]